jgi:hypothetical protein
MSDNKILANIERELMLELRAEQGDRDKEHHVYTQETHSNTRKILQVTTKTKALITTIACLAAVLVAAVIAAGCGVSVAATNEVELVAIELRDQNLRRVIERALWLESNVGLRTAGGAVITDELIRRDAHRVFNHKQFRLDFQFKHPAFKGSKLMHLIEQGRGVFAGELRKLLADEGN